MVSGAEQHLSRSLRAVLVDLADGATIEDSDPFRMALSSLHWFLPTVLGEIHPECVGEVMDGITPVVARKTGNGEAEIFGICIFISDQSGTPLHVLVQVDPVVDEISWLECRLGERGPRGTQGMIRTPYQSQNALYKRLYRLNLNADQVDWVYKVTFGTRRV